jgi:hypothetical protein
VKEGSEGSEGRKVNEGSEGKIVHIVPLLLYTVTDDDPDNTDDTDDTDTAHQKTDDAKRQEDEMDIAMKMSLRLPKTSICFMDLTEKASARDEQKPACQKTDDTDATRQEN